jgi:hypothetical protein
MKISANVTDKLWSAVFCLIVIVAGPGSMFLGALATNVMLGPPMGGSYHGAKAVTEFVLLFGSLFVGLFLACKLIVVLTRHFAAPDSYQRWQKQFEQSISEWPAPTQRLFRFFNRLASPRGAP